MAGDANYTDERSALLQNGYSSEPPEVKLATSSLTGFLLPMCNCSIFDSPWTDDWSS